MNPSWGVLVGRTRLKWIFWPNTKNISIPQSISDRKPSAAIVVMITKDSLFVDGVLVGSAAGTSSPIRVPSLQPLKTALMAQNGPQHSQRAANGHCQARSHHHGRQEHALQRAEENHVDLQRSRVRQGVLCRGRNANGGDLKWPDHVIPQTSFRPAWCLTTGVMICRGRRPRRPSGASASFCASGHRVYDRSRDHALPAANRAGQQHRFLARARGAAGPGAAAATAATAASAAGEARREGAGRQKRRRRPQPVDPRIQSLQERLAGESRRSGGAARSDRSGQISEKPAEEPPTQAMSASDAQHHQLQSRVGTSGGISAPTSSGLASAQAHCGASTRRR